MAFKDLMKEMKGMNIQEMTKKAQLSFEMSQKTLQLTNENNKLLKEISQKMTNVVKMIQAYLNALESKEA